LMTTLNYFIFYCCVGWGNIVAFTLVLKNVSNILTWIHSCLCSHLYLLSHYWNTLNRYHFCINIHVYTLLAPYSSSYHFPCHLSPLTVPTASLPPQNQFCPLVLWFCRRKYIKD
jgi:hypothetical protein